MAQILGNELVARIRLINVNMIIHQTGYSPCRHSDDLLGIARKIIYIDRYYTVYIAALQVIHIRKSIALFLLILVQRIHDIVHCHILKIDGSLNKRKETVTLQCKQSCNLIVRKITSLNCQITETFVRYCLKFVDFFNLFFGHEFLGNRNDSETDPLFFLKFEYLFKAFRPELAFFNQIVGKYTVKHMMISFVFSVVP